MATPTRKAPNLADYYLLGGGFLGGVGFCLAFRDHDCLFRLLQHCTEEVIKQRCQELREMIREADNSTGVSRP